MKTKMKFSDIAGMLERDEMKEIVGGSGSQSGVGPGGSGGFYPSEDALGGSRIRSTFGYGSTFNGSGYTYGNSNYNNVVSKNNSGSASAMSSFTLTGNGNYTTNNSSEINVIYAMLYGSSTSHGINSIYQYAETQAEANAALMIPSDAIHLNNVDVYRNPSGTNNSLNNIFNPNMNYNPYTGSFMGSTGSSNTLDDQQRKPLTDCVFQCIADLAAMYGNTSLSFNSIKDTYNSLASGAISSGIIGNANSGVDAYLLKSITDQYFNRAGEVTTIAQLNNFIKAGGDNFAIGTYSVGNGSSHAVVITGITSDGSQYICRDVQNGGIERFLYTSQFTGFVAITGCCH